MMTTSKNRMLKLAYIFKFNTNFIIYSDGWSGKANCIPLDYHVAEWVQLGTRLVGGCCRIGASDIQRIKRAVDEINNQQ